MFKKGESFSFCLRRISLWTACPQSFNRKLKIGPSIAVIRPACRVISPIGSTR